MCVLFLFPDVFLVTVPKAKFSEKTRFSDLPEDVDLKAQFEFVEYAKISDVKFKIGSSDTNGFCMDVTFLNRAADKYYFSVCLFFEFLF